MSGNTIAFYRKRSGMSQSELAEKIGTTLNMLGKLERGDRTLDTNWLSKIGEALGVAPRDLIGSPTSVEPDQPSMRSVDGGETATVMRMDLSYAMGPGTNIDEDYIEGEPVQLDIGWLRRLTPTAPSMLRIVNGIGDSMFPTIHDSEELVLDLGQHTLNLQDRIWALSLYGVGAVKRLKAIDRERVLVISDNPDVPDQEVAVEDIRLVGRVVGSIRRH